MGLLCPGCGSNDTRWSKRQNFAERIASLIRIAPFRCRTCYWRFFRFRWPETSRKKSTTSPWPAVQSVRPRSTAAFSGGTSSARGSSAAGISLKPSGSRPSRGSPAGAAPQPGTDPLRAI